MQENKLDKLLIEISKGNDASLEELYALTKRGVYSFAYSYLKNRADAEDAMQSTYLKIKLHIGQYRHGTNARAWILQITKNQALNELKKRKRTEELPVEVASPPAEEGTVTALMERVLSDEEREIVILHVLWGYRHREIAKMQNCPVGTVTSKYNRSVQKLKQALKEVGE